MIEEELERKFFVTYATGDRFGQCEIITNQKISINTIQNWKKALDEKNNFNCVILNYKELEE